MLLGLKSDKFVEEDFGSDLTTASFQTVGNLEDDFFLLRITVVTKGKIYFSNFKYHSKCITGNPHDCTKTLAFITSTQENWCFGLIYSEK